MECFVIIMCVCICHSPGDIGQNPMNLTATAQGQGHPSGGNTATSTRHIPGHPVAQDGKTTDQYQGHLILIAVEDICSQLLSVQKTKSKSFSNLGKQLKKNACVSKLHSFLHPKNVRREFLYDMFCAVVYQVGRYFHIDIFHGLWS